MAGSRNNPFEELIGDLTRGFWVKPTGFNASSFHDRSEVTIRIEVREDEKSFMVKAELPGMRKEDITVQIDEDRVSLRAEPVADREEKQGVKTLYTDRNQGPASRTFTLPAPVDSNGAKAEYKEGVLILTLPKASTSTGRKIEVS